MSVPRPLPSLVLFVAIAVAAAACTSSADESSSPPSTSPTSAAAQTTTTQGDDPLLLQTADGPIRGANSEVDGVRQFLDIPYAKPPTGRRAWRPPVPVEPRTDVLDATQPGPSCPQGGSGATGGFVITPPSDPDCLHLNVWAPEEADDLPVMVWIHGGSFDTGSANSPYYNGDDLAAEGVVVVAMNYRLGAEGFLATEELAAETTEDGQPGGGTTGNYGILDQTAALRWVQDNAAAFGGDPDNVTIFGESAGGFSVCAHLASTDSEGLFDRAIIQSGGGCDDFQPREDAFEAGREFMTAVGCDDLACLRSLSEGELSAAPFDPGVVADGTFLDATPRELATGADPGALGELPVLIGATADEATLFTLRTPEPTDAGLVTLVRRYTDDPEALLDLYPAADFATNLDRLRAVFTDVVMACPALDFASVLPQAFAYHFTYVSDRFLTGLGATHGFDLAPLFAHPEGIAAAQPGGDADDLALSDAMQAAWVDFARTGDPGEDFEPYADAGQVTLLDAPITQTDEIRDGRCPAVTELTAG